MSHHLRVAVRMLTARKGLMLARVATIGVVVAAVSSVFTVANATFLRPLPFPNSDRLMLVYQQPPSTTDFASATALLPHSYARLRERVQSFEHFEGELVGERALAGDTEAASVAAARVTAGYFALLGGTTTLGRTFSSQELVEDARVVVLSHALWMRHFGGDPAVVGRSLLIDRESHTIVGVLDADFVPAFVRSELWTPLNTRQIEQQAVTNIRTLARLKPDRTRDDARRELRAHFEAIRTDAPAAMRTGWGIDLVDLRQAVFGSRASVLYMLLAAAAGLTLIAIANLANLTLADVMHRRSDFAVKIALGGNQLDIAAPEIAQSLLLAIVGGLAGLVAANWLVPMLLAIDPLSAFTAAQLSMDWRIAACAFGVAATVMVLAVAVPVLRVAGATVASGVAAGSRRTIGSAGATRLRLVLVGFQTALALVLLAVGALVVATLLQSARLDPGFNPHNVLTAQLRLPLTAFPTSEARNAFIVQVLSRVRSTPGVVQAGTTMNQFVGGAGFTTLVHVEGRPSPDGQPYQVQFRRISPGYFDTLGIRRIEGRDFDDHDLAGGQPVAIVSRSFADRFWPRERLAEQKLKRGPTAPLLMIVGVVDDVRDVSLDQAPADTVYLPVLQNNNASTPISLVVRTSADPATFVSSIKSAVWSVDAKQPLGAIGTMEAFLSGSLGAQRFRAVLVAVCGMFGLLLAIIGTYGVTARSVSERRREVGIRLALGSQQRSVWWSISSSSLKAVALGALGGACASMAADALVRSALPGVEGEMWLFSLAAGTVLTVFAGLAALTAARRASLLDPIAALRAE